VGKCVEFQEISFKMAKCSLWCRGVGLLKCSLWCRGVGLLKMFFSTAAIVIKHLSHSKVGVVFWYWGVPDEFAIIKGVIRTQKVWEPLGLCCCLPCNLVGVYRDQWVKLLGECHTWITD
jgi:hypothetical protein